MGSRMIYVPVEAEISLEWESLLLNTYDVHVLVKTQNIPFDVARWIESYIDESFQLSQEEDLDMVNYTTRKIEFEVEVEYTEQPDGFVKPTNATLQTQGCPNYVKAWLECEAMHQFTKEQEKVKI